MTTLLSDAVANLSQWTVGVPKSKNGQISISGISYKGATPSIQLLPRERLGEIYTPFEPSVFRGTGNEPRKGVVFAIPGDVYDDLLKIEVWARKHLADGTVWHSAIKEPGVYSGSIKAKINVSGMYPCEIVDADGKPLPLPEHWSRLKVVPVLEVRGIYSQKTGSGLILDVTHAMVGTHDVLRSCDFL